MISIRKAAGDLDRLEDLVRAAAEAVSGSIQSVGQYAIEFNPEESRLFRANLDLVHNQSVRADSPEEWHSVQASLRGELRDYRDRAATYLASLRSEVRSAASAMQAFADSVASTGENHEVSVRNAIVQLGEVAKTDTLENARLIVDAATQVITASIDLMRKEHQLVIAQLRDELRLLHQKIEAERKAAFLDRATGVWNRDKIQQRLNELLDRDLPFCVLLVSIRNLRRLDGQYSRNTIENALRAFTQRFAALVGEECAIGRWNEEHFAAFLDVESNAAIRLSRDAAKRLSGTYSVQENGLAVTVPLQAVAGVVDRSVGTDGLSFHQKLTQLSETLASA